MRDAVEGIAVKAVKRQSLLRLIARTLCDLPYCLGRMCMVRHQDSQDGLPSWLWLGELEKEEDGLINGTRPMDWHLYQKDGKPSSPEARELSGTQEHPVWLVRPDWLGPAPLPPSSHSHSQTHWADTPR